MTSTRLFAVLPLSVLLAIGAGCGGGVTPSTHIGGNPDPDPSPPSGSDQSPNGSPSQGSSGPGTGDDAGVGTPGTTDDAGTGDALPPSLTSTFTVTIDGQDATPSNGPSGGPVWWEPDPNNAAGYIVRLWFTDSTGAGSSVVMTLDSVGSGCVLPQDIEYQPATYVTYFDDGKKDCGLNVTALPTAGTVGQLAGNYTGKLTALDDSSSPQPTSTVSLTFNLITQ